METITIKTIGPWMPRGEKILITGNCPLLGEWTPEKALPMTLSQGILWTITLDKKRLPAGFEFKFIRQNNDGSYTWEQCFNRTNPYAVTETTFPDQHPRYAGTAIPVFSLRSRNSAGIGDFGDIKLMVDWAAATGQALLQLLPVIGRQFIRRRQREENILPTICAGTQVRLTERSADCVLFIEESDGVGFDSKTVHTQSIKRQRESRSVFFCRVRRGHKNICKVRRAIPGYVEIDGGIVQNRLVYMEVLVV